MDTPLDNALIDKLSAMTYLQLMGSRIVKNRENIVLQAMKSPTDRRILAEGGLIVTDEEIEFVRERQGKRDAGNWSAVDELKT